MATDSPRPVIDLPTDPREPTAAGSQMLLLGRRIRHARTEKGLTLDELGQLVGSTASQLSLVENGRREPRLSLLQSLAAALGTTTTDLLDAAPPSRRAALEIDLDRAQGTATYAALGLPTVRPAKNLSTEALEALVGLHRELARTGRRRHRDARGGPPGHDGAAPVDARAQQPPARDRDRRRGPGAAGRATPRAP